MIVFEYLQIISQRIIDDEAGFVNELKKKWSEKQSKAPGKAQDELKTAKNRFDELDRLICGLYESFAAGLLPERQYKSLIAKYDTEQQALEQKISELSAETAQYQVPKINTERFVALIKKYKHPKALSREMVREIIHKIVVHQAAGKKPNRTQQVDIYFNFIGHFNLELTVKELSEKRKQEEKAAKRKNERITASYKK